MNRAVRGFTLIELLVALAILGALSAIAIPSLLGQRRTTQVLGDAMTTAKTLQSALESARSDSGSYGPDGTYTWTAGTTDPTTSTLATQWPTFQPGGSRMTYTVTIPSASGASNLSYTLTVTDPTRAGAPMVYQTDDTGADLYRLK